MKIEMSETESDAILYAIHFMEHRSTKLIKSYTISTLKNIKNKYDIAKLSETLRRQRGTDGNK